jgi:hypothetical protein
LACFKQDKIMAINTAFNIIPSIDVATQILENPALQAQLWATQALTAEENSDYYQKWEGTGENSLIRAKNDTAKGDGSYVNWRLQAGFYAPPHFGGQYFDNTLDFEALKQGIFGVQVRRVMHGTSVDSETDEFLGMRGELAAGLPKMQGDWMGRLKSEQIEMVMRTMLPSTNVYYMNGKTVDTITSADTLSFNGIMALKETAATQGGQPARTEKDDEGNVIMGYTLTSAQQALYGLEIDPNFIGALKTTRDVKAAETYFDGGWEKVRGVIIDDRRVIDHDGYGPIGSPLNPKAFLGNAVSSSSTAITILGGGDAASAAQPVDYFRYFINNPYAFQAAGTVGSAFATVPQDNQTHYVLIVNPANAPAGYVSNGIGFYSYTTGFNSTSTSPGGAGGNPTSGYSLTLTGQLGPVNNGYQATTIGSVVYNTGVWATALNGGNIITTSHPVGSMIYQVNAKGQPIGFSEFFGKGGIYRGYGMNRLKRSQTMFQGDTIKQLYIRSTFGQVPRVDTRGRTPAAFGLWHAIPYPNTPIPQAIV